MKNIIKTIFLAVYVFFFFGCSEKPEIHTGIEVVNPDALVQELFAEQTNATSIVFITTGETWTATHTDGADTWIVYDPEKGETPGRYTVYIALRTNATGHDRTAFITIHCGGENIHISITQKAVDSNGNLYEEPEGPPKITVVNSAALVQELAADQTKATSVVFVTAGAWTSTLTEGAASWIVFDPVQGNASGRYTVSISLTPNTTGNDRTAVFTIRCDGDEREIIITQSILQYRRLPVKVYRSKMKAGWIGQIAGVCWGAPTEFVWIDKIIPVASMPVWKPDMINEAFNQDDLYVEMTFLRTMEEYGINVSIRQAGIDFANSEYPLWCANDAGRRNLGAGIGPPDSSHPRFNSCPNDIDYQIESDFAGLIAPGMPNVAIEMGNKFGRLMNYGDGIYGGQFVGGMYCEAFFEDDILKIIDAGLACIPAGSHYAEMVRDMVAWYKENPNDWEATWQKCQKKYREDPEYQKASNGRIDVRINGSYILMGLLYGKYDLDNTIIISTRCGLDSDCNPSNAGGVLFTTVGFENLPARFTEKLNYNTKFIYTEYNINTLLNVTEKLMRDILIREGGRIEKDASNEDVFVIPVKTIIPNTLELSWAPGQIEGSMFTDEEIAKIRFGLSSLRQAVALRFPGWVMEQTGWDMSPAVYASLRGKNNVLLTHPVDLNTPAVLSTTVAIPSGKTTTLRLVVGHYETGDWDLVIRVNGVIRKTVTIGKTLTNNTGWAEVTYDLTSFAGNNVKIDLENKANGWAWEAGYWAEIEIKSE